MTATWLRILKWCEWIGGALLLVVACVFAVDVLLRYVFGITRAWVVDLEWYTVAVALCLSFAPALAHDAHVRVDVLRERMSPRLRKWIEILGHALFLFPWLAFLLYACWRYAYNSALILEGSPDPGGLPGRYLIKSVLVFGLGLLLIEGMRQLLTRLKPNA